MPRSRLPISKHRSIGQRENATDIRVLRLFGKHRLSDLTRAVEKALKVRAVTKDAIEQFLPPVKPWSQTSFRLAGRKHLRFVQISKTNIKDYGTLRGGSGGAA